MPVVEVGEKLPSVYLDRFTPVEGLVYRLSVLDTKAIAVESHWVDVPSKDIKGSYECIQGVCCVACGRRRQTYNIPIFVYRDPQHSTEGEIQVWSLTAPQWKKFSDLALQVDLKVYDLMLSAQKRGWGLDQSYSVIPDVQLRQYWTPEQKEQIPQAVDSFYQLGEGSLVNVMNLNDWNSLLYGLGFDFQNNCWPGGQSPLNSGRAMRAVGMATSALGYPGMAPVVPIMGQQAVLPPAPVVQAGVPVSSAQGNMVSRPGQVGGTIFQPPKPPAAIFGQSGQAGFVPPQVPQTVVVPPLPVGGAGPQTVTGGVPLGTPPVIPQTAMQAPIPSAQAPIAGNEVSNQVTVTEAEMQELLK
jgi:hypothetical protein